jgi:hypothetical protein
MLDQDGKDKLNFFCMVGLLLTIIGLSTYVLLTGGF